MDLRSIFFTVVLLLATGDAYNILIIYLTPMYSHQQTVMALTETLIKKGHQLFVVSPNVVQGLEKNYTFVDLSFSRELYGEGASIETVKLDTQLSKWDMIKVVEGWVRVADLQFQHQEFLNFYKRVKEEQIKFDVVISQYQFLSYGCAMSRLLNGLIEPSPSSPVPPPPLPLISLATVSRDDFAEDHIGSIGHRSYLPFILTPYTDRMTLWQKMDNWFSSGCLRYSIMNTLEQGARDFFREIHGDDSLVDGCYANVSLTMRLSNFIYNYPQLLGPNVIELGPLHIKEPGKLPQNIQDWLDGAEKGVVYFSLGSNMKSKSLPQSVRENFLKFFLELPPGYRVLWKWELDGKIPGQSDNILGQKWAPQPSVLAHPKVKVFITQGGLQSFQEAVHYGVPTVGIPWFADQEHNVAKMVDAGIGSSIQPPELYSYEKIKSALETVLYDESYTRNMKKLSAISREFTSQSHDKAVFWIEHVAKFGGAPHLRPSTADATLFEYFCFDILAVILVFTLTVLYVTKLVLRIFVSRIVSFSNSKIKTK